MGLQRNRKINYEKGAKMFAFFKFLALQRSINVKYVVTF